jgi:hypothetical protein
LEYSGFAESNVRCRLLEEILSRRYFSVEIVSRYVHDVSLIAPICGRCVVLRLDEEALPDLTACGLLLTGRFPGI